MGNQHDEAMAREIADNQSDTAPVELDAVNMAWHRVIAIVDRIYDGEPVDHIPTSWEIMTNGSDELFVRFGVKEIRLTRGREGFTISDWNSPGKLTLDGQIYVR